MLHDHKSAVIYVRVGFCVLDPALLVFHSKGTGVRLFLIAQFLRHKFLRGHAGGLFHPNQYQAILSLLLWPVRIHLLSVLDRYHQHAVRNVHFARG